jgi:hypothetical protein
MALHEAHREDLFAEATALIRRIELHAPGEVTAVVAGCRSSGAWSICFGPDPCYHFDPQGCLRRAFVDDRLYRTQGRTLARLSRSRQDGAVALLRSDLSAGACRDFLERMRGRLEALRQALSDGTAARLRCHPGECALEAELSAAIRRIIAAGPALAPPIPTRRD